jgi:hypothetical protein
MPPQDMLRARIAGQKETIGIVNGLIARLKEKRADLEVGGRPAPSSYFDKLNLHARIADIARDLFLDGHHFEAVFNALRRL